ncbi:hypothetical protein [Bradyrhizobium japonicum]|nr:hypothetical protein [Bradyrhizobium japonicum]MCS3978749.1 hypothetical protein [Bradyrhizobium japonicum]MEB2673726.1 hypothetical protein [Bradyrhizobium japonicum]WRI74640.1 hypothetical protein RZE83_16140 [Bradyrhizobium japonicum]WRI83438.1 hypothetical protein R3F76_16045 [Bradyrhizobium japonicum]WRI92923.1 hypothetical protein R3F75_19110 [Bradyrhizobium japonicum]
MRISPSIVPGSERDIYLVLDDFGGRLGRAWTERTRSTLTARHFCAT